MVLVTLIFFGVEVSIGYNNVNGIKVFLIFYMGDFWIQVNDVNIIVLGGIIVYG